GRRRATRRGQHDYRTFSVKANRAPEQTASSCQDGLQQALTFKAHAIKSHTHTLIANDVSATNASIKANRVHGLVVALLDVTYNDDARSFQKWHTALKGGKSAYEQEREERTAVSRYRKRDALLREIVFVEITDPKRQCGIHRQGRNSNGKPRPAKYSVDLESLDRNATTILTFR
ncbi:MAG: hypothetical protein ACYCPH_03520, partial [Minisyncoccota bacterium]